MKLGRNDYTTGEKLSQKTNGYISTRALARLYRVYTLSNTIEDKNITYLLCSRRIILGNYMCSLCTKERFLRKFILEYLTKITLPKSFAS